MLVPTLLLLAAGKTNAVCNYPIFGSFCFPGDFIQAAVNILTGNLAMITAYNIWLPGIPINLCLNFGSYPEEFKDIGIEYLPDSRPDVRKGPMSLLAWLGGVGEKDNFFFKKTYKMPLSVAWDAINKKEEDGGYWDVVKEGFADQPSPWPLVKNGLWALGAGGLEEMVISFDSSVSNYSYTYRIVNILSPLATGGTVNMGVFPSKKPEETVFYMRGRIKNLVPACILSVPIPYTVWDPVLRKAERQWNDGAYIFNFEGTFP
eukprot:CAMPEP_0119317890 /NCGR_PEP_ID=MMETSP1333-20130426/44761_1 /TAXON_ID=418940 /ORGANISM="Scyphosphaera apsteinii, Strain RCC1455" /LENGTH=260 /DNA_ID=CAMNT_0007323959 /DNA_START=81 /DNA_END=860 /DNA_ORIENTATION=+